MGENSAISWTDHTFNPWIGCARVSPACDGCYAAALMGGEADRFRRAEWGGPGKGEGTRDRTKDWSKPRKWNREAASAQGRTFVFCASLADVFDNHPDVAPWRLDLFGLIRDTPHLTWLLLTKRPGNIVRLFRETVSKGDGTTSILAPLWPPNAAIGCTVVSQAEADRDVPKLLAATAELDPAFAFVSMEPLLGPVNLRDLPSGPLGPRFGIEPHHDRFDALHPSARVRLDWVITGGETDQGAHKARPSHPDWFRSLRDQCAAAGVAYHHKQWGEFLPEGQFDAEGFQWAPGSADPRVYWWSEPPAEGPLPDGACSIRVGKKAAGRLLDGVTHDARPVV